MWIETQELKNTRVYSDLGKKKSDIASKTSLLWKELSSFQVMLITSWLKDPRQAFSNQDVAWFLGDFFLIFLENHFNTKMLKGKIEPPHGFHMTHCQKFRRQPCDHF